MPLAHAPTVQPRTQASLLARPSRDGRRWWQDTVVYQIYPRSFQDSNGDGIGDIPGILSRLDYLRDLGVGTLWLSPIFASPNDDNGYDISDYDAIHPEFGTLDDFDQLIEGAHRRGLRVILDLVVNHTSDEHPWFRAARASRDNPWRAFYHWHPGRPDGSAPNNWESFFKGPAWDLDLATGEYYLHLFSRKQPDLNWTNPAVRREIHAMMHRWLKRGVDGFRMDVINFLAKAPGWPDARASDGSIPPLAFGAGLYANQPGIHEILTEMHEKVLRNYDLLSVGECHFVPGPAAGLDYVAPERRELDLLFPFDLVYESDRRALPGHVDRWHGAFSERATPAYTLNNHDTPRLVSKFGAPPPHTDASAKLLATLLLTAPGVPFLYQGEELGMTNVSFSSIHDYRDIEMLNRHRELVASGVTEDEALARLRPACRDNARTPMQWSDAPNAGFTTGTPWIGLNPEFPFRNARAQESDSSSVLAFYRRLLKLRRALPALHAGEHRRLRTEVPGIFAHERRLEADRVWIFLNLSDAPAATDLGCELQAAESLGLLLSNQPREHVHCAGHLRLAPWEACIWRVEVD